mmetsp:Transcript_32080/g.46239  ORF Transcript_32080/g.46239 Transcript_32080/m.46239 type:complete len:558 (-) Transcript_32080:59-1732(-)
MASSAAFNDDNATFMQDTIDINLLLTNEKISNTSSDGSYGSPSISQTPNNSTPTDKKIAVTGIKREQVLSNDPLLDHLNSPPPNEPEDEYPPVGFSHEVPKTAPIPRYPIVDPYVSSNETIKQKQPVDKIDVLAENFIRTCRIQPIPLAAVPFDVAGLSILVSASAWSSVVSFTAKLCRNETPILENNKLNIVFQYRFEGLFRMKLYDDLLHEVGEILTDEELKLQSHITTSVNKPSDLNNKHCLSFSLRLYIVEVKLMTGRSQEALEHLSRMRRWLQQEIKSDTANPLEYWLWQVKLHEVNAHIRLRNWKVVTQELKSLIDETQIRWIATPDSDVAVKLDWMKAQIVLLMRLSRVLLQLGDVKSSTHYFDEASRIYAFNIGKDNSLQQLLLLSQALLLFSTDQYPAAADVLSKIIDAESQSVSTVSHFSGQSQEAQQFFESSPLLPIQSSSSGIAYAAICMQDLTDDFVITSAINNFAICALYRKNISEAVVRLENLIRVHPVRFMTDPVIFNLCTLYDLTFSPDVSTSKKKMLQKVALKYHIEDPMVHWRSFRLN